MAIEEHSYTVTAAGENGSATGTTTTDGLYGELIAISIVYSTSGVNTTDTTVVEASGMARTLLTNTNSDTDKVFYPSVPRQDTAGNDVTYDGTNEIPMPFFLAGRKLTLTVAQGNAGTVVFIIQMRR